MKKAFKIAYAALFFAVCATPLALMPFVKSNAEIEKKALTEMPSFVSDGKINTDFSTQFESWFNDRLPLRSQLLSAANLVKGELLSSPSSNVISGSDGYGMKISIPLDWDTEQYVFSNYHVSATGLNFSGCASGNIYESNKDQVFSSWPGNKKLAKR